ncbi:hypothetical protein AB0D37_39730 [Streptomyces sp. NPDC048384]|uniref:hypothetical protein n=1 Tax=Streptomyces sp. NPDC048384 TaxID=3155487 RepID=UPI00344844C4
MKMMQDITERTLDDAKDLAKVLHWRAERELEAADRRQVRADERRVQEAVEQQEKAVTGAMTTGQWHQDPPRHHPPLHPAYPRRPRRRRQPSPHRSVGPPLNWANSIACTWLHESYDVVYDTKCW